METQLVLNRIKTPDGTILTSYSVHDYVTYTDKNGLEYMIDGGTQYLRRTIHSEAPYEELSVSSDAPFEIVRKSFHRGSRGKDGTSPLTWVPMNEMNDNWLAACIVYNSERGVGDGFASELYRAEIEYRKQNNITIKN